MSKKPSNAEVVLALPAKQKVDLLAQALLREYMHRRGFKRTLAAFDLENPRTETTISSRQLMLDLMKLQAIQERNKKRGDQELQSSSQVKLQPFGTIMEMLCSYRIRKRSLKLRQQPLGGKAPDVEGPRSSGPESDSSDEEADLRARAMLHQSNVKKAEAEVQGETEALQQRLKELQAEIARWEKKEAKLHKVKKEGGGKKSDKKKKGAEDVDATSAGKKKESKKSQRDNTGSEDIEWKAPASILKKDPLKDAMAAISSLPISASGASSRSGAGRNWTPGGSGAIPIVGLNAAASSNLVTSDRPPSFVAGEGFHLMVDRAPPKTSAPEWEAPSSSVLPRRNSGSLSAKVEDDEEVPSPYRLGKTVYDPTQKVPSVLVTEVKKEHDHGGGAATRDREGSGGREPASLPRRDSGGSLEGSPTAPAPSVGFNFASREGSPNVTTGTKEGGRKSRRVTIIAD